ncbi:chromatin structure-remodeling complex subunit RSC7 [Coemansia sp. RSA 1822]|nr:chromatin structure-remodeling complex subunit RSC7 [Coemansia sp. RSA 638]KAJ2542339.1 chromatin structure-remodeling complex subunit RSC7 [Coemansia sp. RSA 1853]KAJ2566256.1 chromatin structure-remodeling complex subunit RSC7 [Coemansia sp. RSA 1822]
MPTMRRSTRGSAKKSEQAGVETPTRRGRAASRAQNGELGELGELGGELNGAKAAGVAWSESSSPLSSISTPASGVGRERRSLRQRAHSNTSGMPRDESDEESEDVDVRAVSNLLSQAAASIRNKVDNNQLTEDEDNADDETGRSTRSRASAPEKRRRRESQDELGTPLKRPTNDSGTPNSAKAETNGMPRKRGRPSRQTLEQRRLAESGDTDAPQTPGSSQYLQTPRAPQSATRRTSGDDSSDDDEAEKDSEGETKIDSDGYLQGGREFICPIFRSPFRRNTQRQYVLTMDCCRYMGARDSYMLFKQHPRMRRVETTQQERDLLADRMMIPKVTRFRPIALITARTAFREFGARIVKNGRYIVDDYWVESRRREARHPEGTLVANMGVYHSVMAAHAAGVTPGSTRKARRTTPLRSSDAQTPTRMPAKSPGGMMSSWVQLEAQQRVQPVRAGGLTMANALQQPAPALAVAQGPLQLLHNDAADSDPDDAKLARSKPVFRKTRAPETADAAFESAVSTHRALFAEDHGFVDGLPLIRCMTPSWPPATSLTHRLKQRHDVSADSRDVCGPMAYASGKMAREFNASIRMWREDNGCTWIDPHTGVRQVPSSLQPTRVRVERVDTGSGWRRAGKMRVEPQVAFADSVQKEERGEYPLALLPGQFQETFPVHRTRFGMSYQQTMGSYSYHWMRLLAQQQQRKTGQLPATPHTAFKKKH